MVLNPPRSGLLFPDLGGCRQRGPSDRKECYKLICRHQHSFVDSLISLTEESSMEIFRRQRAVLWGDTGGLIPGTERAAGGAVGGLASLSFQYHILVQLPLSVMNHLSRIISDAESMWHHPALTIGSVYILPTLRCLWLTQCFSLPEHHELDDGFESAWVEAFDLWV